MNFSFASESELVFNRVREFRFEKLDQKFVQDS